MIIVEIAKIIRIDVLLKQASIFDKEIEGFNKDGFIADIKTTLSLNKQLSKMENVDAFQTDAQSALIFFRNKDYNVLYYLWIEFESYCSIAWSILKWWKSQCPPAKKIIGSGFSISMLNCFAMSNWKTRKTQILSFLKLCRSIIWKMLSILFS